jgi:hypothetical protein
LPSYRVTIAIEIDLQFGQCNVIGDYGHEMVLFCVLPICGLAICTSMLPVSLSRKRPELVAPRFLRQR